MIREEKRNPFTQGYQGITAYALPVQQVNVEQNRKSYFKNHSAVTNCQHALLCTSKSELLMDIMFPIRECVLNK